MKTTNVKAIKEFFEKDGGRPVQMKELKELSIDERAQLGKMCADALGKEIETGK